MTRELNGDTTKLERYLETLQLTFTLPGADWYELKEGGAEIVVTAENVADYLRLLPQHWLVDSVAQQVEALKTGMEDVFPVSSLKCFGPEEFQVGRLLTKYRA